MKKKIAIVAAVTASVLSLCTACDKGDKVNRGEEIPYIPPVIEETYENSIDVSKKWGENTNGSWTYGIGDPFVMRYNGRYYMYPSTWDNHPGVKVYVSDDMVNWQYVGFALEEAEDSSVGAYAPEVVYYNGYFYMCQSRAGRGHYIYRSESPTEGFKLISTTNGRNPSDLDYGNLGMGIDGSFYVSDDGRLYLMHTVTPNGLRQNEITDVNDIRLETLGRTGVIGDASLNHWIEGPGIFRRGETSYLTYTGNHVTSVGYRVAYSYANNMDGFNDFIQPVQNVTMIDEDEHYGLGHSSNANGPDLDSVYTAYHNLMSHANQFRGYNLDRYFAFGSVLTANGPTYRAAAVPSRPTKEAQNAEGFTVKDGYYALGETDNYYTVEYNLIPSSGQRLVFGASNGSSYRIGLDGAHVSLYRANASGETLIAQRSAVYPQGKLSTVRVENGDGVGYVYINGMRVITYEAEAAPGGVGVTARNGVYYTAFTNDVFGTSDFEVLKNFPLTFPAITYLKGENRGFSFAEASVVKGGVRVGEKQSVVKVADAYAVHMQKGDWVKYGITVPEKDTYVLGARVAIGSKGTVKVTVGEESFTAEIDATAEAFNSIDGTRNVSLGKIKVPAGAGCMKVEVLSGTVDFISFTAEEKAGLFGSVKVADFEKLSGSVANDGSTITLNGGATPAAARWGKEGMSNYEASFTFRMDIDGGANLGFMIRSQHYSYHKDQPTQSWQGYYVRLGARVVTVKRYDYGEETLVTAYAPTLEGNDLHTLTVRAEGSTISVSVDGELLATVTDDYAYLSGYIGAYASTGNLSVVSVNYTVLD
ncbi:MAG: family 43 glycosylhydrolase [Clostridia bacterium]|nr:family 43 glycosylhydrolase [Clostridia bacterium]